VGCSRVQKVQWGTVMYRGYSGVHRVQRVQWGTVGYRRYVIIVCTRRQLALIKRLAVYCTIIQTKKVSAGAWRVATGDWRLATGEEGVATNISNQGHDVNQKHV